VASPFVAAIENEKLSAPVEWHEVPYRDPARPDDRSLVSIRPEVSGLLDRRLLLPWAVWPPPADCGWGSPC